jgi:hypothetical protein
MFVTPNTFMTTTVPPVQFSMAGSYGQSGQPFNYIDNIPADATAALVFITFNRGQTPNYSYATLGGIPMRQLMVSDNGGGHGALFGLINPPTGNQTIAVSYATPVAFASFLTGASTYYKNVKAFGMPVGNPSTASLVVPVKTGQMAAGGFAFVNAFTPNVRHDIPTASFVGYALTDGDATPASGATSVTLGAGSAGLAAAVPLLNIPLGPLHDSVSNGYYPASTSGTLTFPHSATAGADAIVDITVDRTATISAVTYNGVGMTLLGSVSFTGASGTGTLARYRATNVAGGIRTVSFNVSTTAVVTAGAVSLLNITSVGTTTTTSGAASQPSQAVTCTPGQLILESIAMRAAPGTPSGGTNLWNSQGGSASLTLQQNIANASTTFSMSPTNVSGWGALATTFS